MRFIKTKEEAEGKANLLNLKVGRGGAKLGKEIQKLGLTGNSNFTYEIIWFEEVYQMDENSVNDVKLAVRGAKYTLTMFTTNPYVAGH